MRTRNAAFVFCGLFLTINLLILLAIFLSSIILAINLSNIQILFMNLLGFALPVAVISLFHFGSARQMLVHPTSASIIELLPGFAFLVIGLIFSNIIFSILSLPHMLVGCLTLLSLERNQEAVYERVK
ncbi:MAG TPA: hypothetical protein VH186_26395 [Chloroflexia bacterium]|nr:hypothetical protein [Chloroflexia bacterium]